MKSAKRSLCNVSPVFVLSGIIPAYQKNEHEKHLHMARSLEDLIGGKHGALECHHLLSSDEVISPHVDDMALKTL